MGTAVTAKNKVPIRNELMSQLTFSKGILENMLLFFVAGAWDLQDAHTDRIPFVVKWWNVSSSKIGVRPNLSQTVDNPRFAEIVRRHFELHAITEVETDKALPHFTGNMGQHHLIIGKLYT